MKIGLAGYNVDTEHGSSTPETISAAYARISRDPRPVEALRKEAAGEVERARDSNRRIVFGYGHGSVAEHAFFNFDVMGLSRLVTEALQSFRLASFTEKSQRYVDLGRDWVVPQELPDDLKDEWKEELEGLFGLYRRASSHLKESGLPGERAREDARYLLPLAVCGQMGMSMNARELEHAVRRLAAHPLAEARELSERLLASASAAAPSLLRYLNPVEMDRFAWRLPPAPEPEAEEVVLVRADGDEVVGARLLQYRKGISLEGAREAWNLLEPRRRRQLFEEVMTGLGAHDAVPRDWELAGFTFQLFISATAYAQLKRHRMSTQLPSDYSPRLGLRVPPSFEENGIAEMVGEAAEAHRRWRDRLPGQLAAYMLTNAHRRSVVVRMNGRELYHFSRLRMDSHAQWDIRQLAGRMVGLAVDRAPLTLSSVGGKSQLED